MVLIIEFTCTCPAVCRLYLSPCRCYFPVATRGMSIYHYFKARDGLPDPRGSLLQLACCPVVPYCLPLRQQVPGPPGWWEAVEVLTERNFVSGQTIRSLRFYERSSCILSSIIQSILQCTHDKTVQQFSYVSNHQCFGEQAFLRLHKKFPSFDQLINATGYVLRVFLKGFKFIVKFFIHSNLNGILLTENLEKEI